MCDNASNNDVMIEELEHLLNDFPGAANQMRCFAHIINLVVKSILRQFDGSQHELTEVQNVQGGVDCSRTASRSAQGELHLF